MGLKSHSDFLFISYLHPNWRKGLRDQK